MNTPSYFIFLTKAKGVICIIKSPQDTKIKPISKSQSQSYKVGGDIDCNQN